MNQVLSSLIFLNFVNYAFGILKDISTLHSKHSMDANNSWNSFD